MPSATKNKFIDQESRNQTKEITQKLRFRRIANGISQETLACALGTQNAYSKLERGNIKFQIESFITICDILDYPLVDIFEL